MFVNYCSVIRKNNTITVLYERAEVIYIDNKK